MLCIFTSFPSYDSGQPRTIEFRNIHSAESGPWSTQGSTVQYKQTLAAPSDSFGNAWGLGEGCVQQQTQSYDQNQNKT